MPFCMNLDNRNEIHCNENRLDFFFSWGLSHSTAEIQNGSKCGTSIMSCPGYPEHIRGSECHECSMSIAEQYLDDLNEYKNNIITATKDKCFDPALLAAFISRQTRGGYDLYGTDGWIQCHNDHASKCFGIMHIPEC